MAFSFWEYKICDCSFKVTQEWSLIHEREGHWALTADDVDYVLEDGLRHLGNKGWELAGIQTATTFAAQHSFTTYSGNPSSSYVFKRAVETM